MSTSLTATSLRDFTLTVKTCPSTRFLVGDAVTVQPGSGISLSAWPAPANDRGEPDREDDRDRAAVTTRATETGAARGLIPHDPDFAAGGTDRGGADRPRATTTRPTQGLARAAGTSEPEQEAARRGGRVARRRRRWHRRVRSNPSPRTWCSSCGHGSVVVVVDVLAPVVVVSVKLVVVVADGAVVVVVVGAACGCRGGTVVVVVVGIVVVVVTGRPSSSWSTGRHGGGGRRPGDRRRGGHRRHRRRRRDRWRRLSWS